MSVKVALLVRNADEDDVIPIILSPDSGFREDPMSDEFRKPLEWGVAETLALVGIIVAVAQLAVSIYEILHKSPGSSVELRPLEPHKNSIVIVIKEENLTPEEIAQRIIEGIGHERG